MLIVILYAAAGGLHEAAAERDAVAPPDDRKGARPCPQKH